MASLKEVKTRISSVNGTRKITSAMKMVASSKLHQAQQTIERMRPYQERLNGLLQHFLRTVEAEVDTPFSVIRDIRRIALVVFTSNTSLCGAFNATVIKTMRQQIAAYEAQQIEVKIYPVGKKAYEAARKLGYAVEDTLCEYLDKPSYASIAQFSRGLMTEFREEKIDKVELIYQHFKSAGAQVLTQETLLPLLLSEAQDKSSSTTLVADYLVEPSSKELLATLLPKSITMQLYATLLDSLAAEHAARVVAMQTATDNADELLRTLVLQYNKTRQQAITAELLDIVGGSMA